jgi:YVTN family beta-propeller protein
MQVFSRTCAGRAVAASLAISLSGTFSAMAVESAPLTLQAKIPLGDVRGRIDHLAIDHARQRLFVAELGNNSLSVVDLKGQKVLHRIAGLNEPQGVAYVSGVDSIFVSNGGDGSIRIFSGDDLSPRGRVDLGDDADNLRVDQINNLVLAGFGSGGLAVIDARSRAKLVEIGLKGHPEGFELEPSSKRVFVNVPDVHEIAVLDRILNRQTETWKFTVATGNFSMAVRQKEPELLTVFRRPPRLAAINTRDGNASATVPTCGDPDDIFVDEGRDRAYVSCGEGFIDVFQLAGVSASRIAHIATAAGARTAFYDPELDRFYLGVRATSHSSAAIWLYKPQGR